MSCTGIYDLLLKYFPDNNMCHPGKSGGTHLSEACTYPLLRLTSKAFCSMFQLWYHLKERELLWESVPSPLIYWVRPACKRHIPGEHHSLSLSEACSMLGQYNRRLSCNLQIQHPLPEAWSSSWEHTHYNLYQTWLGNKSLRIFRACRWRSSES